MKVNTKNESKEDDLSKVKQKVVSAIKIGKAIRKFIHARILLLLLVYKELSIMDLCKILDKSWPTINRHLKILEEAGIVEIRRVSGKGPKKKKIYSVKSDILEQTRLDYDELKELPFRDVKYILSRELRGDIWTMEFVQKLIDDLIPYLNAFEKQLRDIKFSSSETSVDFYCEYKASHYLEALDEEEYAFYLEKYKDLYKELSEFRKKKRKQEVPIKTARPYGVFHIIMPLKKIQESNYNLYWLEKE